MSSFSFCIRDVELSPSEVAGHRAIAEQHGAEFIYPGRMPGTPTTGWFTAPNLGEPFDRDRARAVRMALLEAGLIPRKERER